MVGGYVPFAGDDESDPFGATIALRKAGFFAMRMPGMYRDRIEIPGDDFVFVATNAPEDYNERIALISAFMYNVNAIVERYGGGVFEDIDTFGDLGDPDPWQRLFSPWRPSD
jgi:hypothetical protein